MSIVRMQKLTLLCQSGAVESTLQALRELGVLHVCPMNTPGGAGVEAARAKVETLRRVIEAVPVAADGAKAEATAPADFAQQLSALLDERRSLQDAAEKVQAELVRLSPFGTFDPADIQALAAQGVVLKLFRAPLKATPDLPEGVAAQMLSSHKADGYWVLFGKGDFEWPGAEEVRCPEKGPAALRHELDGIAARQDEITARFAAAAPSKAALQGLLADAEAELKFEHVRSGMADADGLVAAVQGFLPAADVDKVRAAAAANGWGLVVEEPGPKDDVPVKLRQPRWARPIQAVFDGINILPAYNEADVSVVVMLFFSLFFAMIIGDAGYGAIFLALTLVFYKKMARNAGNLLVVTSVATIVWGLITGTVFGIDQHWLQDHGFARFWPTFLNPLDPVAEHPSAQNLMGMCFLIGAVQITIGHLWNTWDLLREKSTKALEQIGWVCTTWYMFFLADYLVIGGNMVKYLGSPAYLVPFSGSVIDGMCVAGILLIALFMLKPSEFKDSWFNLALLPLNIINNFTDVVSYVRLYAVGAAGFAVANAFNEMIMPMIGGNPVMMVVTGIFAVLLLFLAHVLNILLCVMGVMVHGIRLNTLEFSNHKGISWSGAAYRPFAKETAA